MLLTIGCPTHNDQKGLAFTFTLLREQIVRLGLRDRVELLAVDNHPQGAEAEAVKTIVRKCRGVYVPFGDAEGAAPPRNELFRRAAGDWVLCLDSHVWLLPGVLERIVDFVTDNQSPDLYQGILLSSGIYTDDGRIDPLWTHAAPVMGADGLYGRAATNPAALDPDCPPFEISASGIWLFLARREQWLGFNPQFRGFGIEGYINAKYRQAGRKSWCLPFIRGWHWFRDAKSQPVKQDMSWTNRTRNALLSFQEVGVPTLTDVWRTHVQPGRTQEADWLRLCAELSIDAKTVMAGEEASGVRRQASGTAVLSHNAPLTSADQQTLKQLPCSARGRRSGTVLCNQGCPSNQSTPWATFDCRSHGLVTLSAVRKDLRSCVDCAAAGEIESLPAG